MCPATPPPWRAQRRDGGWFPARQVRGKYGAVPTFVLHDGSVFTRTDLLMLAAYRGVATEVVVKHRTGPPSPRPMTLRELAAALGMRGEAFASKLEARRWSALRLEECGGRIRNLRRQVAFPLHAPGGQQVGRYVADFVYEQNGQVCVEDAKGFRTAEFIRSRKHMAAEHGVVVIETRKG